MRQIARREDIRDLILDAVDVLLAKFCYKKMTMDDVARQIGIGKGTIYLHFPGKEELILSHIDRIADRIVAKLQEIAGTSDSPERRIECADSRTTSFVLIQSTNSLLPFSLSARELGRRETVEDQVGRIADLLIKGLLPCPSRPASWTR
ncbi:MAG: TetR/AcrR family transcriptional regulator [Candidatus Aminicenantes bacterium]|nr:TetR/AcrR family transcriptional regulator [Candidatus Aminicenantes bacterium]